MCIRDRVSTQSTWDNLFVNLSQMDFLGSANRASFVLGASQMSRPGHSICDNMSINAPSIAGGRPPLLPGLNIVPPLGIGNVLTTSNVRTPQHQIRPTNRPSVLGGPGVPPFPGMLGPFGHPRMPQPAFGFPGVCPPVMLGNHPGMPNIYGHGGEIDMTMIEPHKQMTGPQIYNSLLTHSDGLYKSIYEREIVTTVYVTVPTETTVEVPVAPPKPETREVECQTSEEDEMQLKGEISKISSHFLEQESFTSPRLKQESCDQDPFKSRIGKVVSVTIDLSKILEEKIENGASDSMNEIPQNEDQASQNVQTPLMSSTNPLSSSFVRSNKDNEENVAALQDMNDITNGIANMPNASDKLRASANEVCMISSQAGVSTGKETKEKKTFANGEFYLGELKRAMRHGFGVQYHTNGTRKYEGLWEDDAYHGLGKFFAKNIEEIPDCGNMDPRDLSAFRDYLVRYEGHFFRGRMEGTGTLYLPNNQKFVGSFKKGKINGDGLFYRSNGEVVFATWNDNKMEKKGNH
eukprot:TRINITY_DN11533_c0_g3_i3.p1 TRINITY_DN11533_c0_g3~~TRINITY_DN11533_c0_g3_i3.p1  ORF type:complete len:544 (+),score=112.92 TRINITY_DN11533_c0_g3_i3:73-1632(+)